MDIDRSIQCMTGRGPGKQRGAAMVEFALTISLFMMLVLAIFEFSLLLMNMVRANEVSRDLARIAIVNDPVCDIYEEACPGGGLTCPGGDEVVLTLADADADCSTSDRATACLMMTAAQRHLPAIQPEQVELRYACSATGAANRPLFIPLVTVSLLELEHEFRFAGLLGMETKMQMPDFDTSRVGEDMYTRRP